MLPSSSPRYNTDTITTQLLHYYPRPFNCLPRQISIEHRSFPIEHSSRPQQNGFRDESPSPKDDITQFRRS